MKVVGNCIVIFVVIMVYSTIIFDCVGATALSVSDYIDCNVSRYAIDTTGSEPKIAVRIETNGNFSQLDSIGINTGYLTACGE